MKLYLLLLLSFCSFSVFAQDLKPTDDSAKVTLLVTDYEGIPEQFASLRLKSKDGTFSKAAKTNEEGKYTMLLPEGQVLEVEIDKFDMVFDFEIEIPSFDGGVNFEQTFKIDVVKDYVRNYILENVYFDTDKHNIKKESLPALRQLLTAMNENPKMKVEIAGHTDNVGDDEYNMKLSQLRANSIVNWLMEKGIDESRVLAKGYGEKKPIASNNSAEGKAKNRRTEVKVIEE